MTSDQQESDLNNTVQKPAGLNPLANTFYSSKSLSAPAEKAWKQGEDLTNGDLSLQDDVGGGFSSGDSPVSDSPPAPIMEGTLEAGAPPPEFVPDPTIAVSSIAPVASSLVMSNETESSVDGEHTSCLVEHPRETAPPAEMARPVPMLNGLSHGQPHQGSGGDGAQAPEPSAMSPPSDLCTQLRNQLEYYFSRDNLVQDHYLQSQMDGDQYVPITTIANFNQVVKLTTDYDFIVDVLKNSKVVQVDETGTKVRPRLNRTVLMLREIPDNTPKEEVEALFMDERCPRLVHCEFTLNGYWYVTFNTDEDAASAYCFLREKRIMFRNKPVLARIKARPLVRPGGGGPYMNKTPSQPQQEARVPFMQQQQNQFPLMAPAVPQFVNQQQVPQPVNPFHLYNLPTMLPQWTNAAGPAFMDPGAMLTLNGLQATAVKPSTNHNRQIYHHPVRTNNRGMGKPHHQQRPQSISTDKVQEPRGGSMDHRPHNTNHLSSRTSPRNNSNHSHHQHQHQHHAPPLESLPTQPPPFARSRSEGTSSGGNSSSHFNTSHHQPSGVSSAPVPLVPHDDPLHLPPQPPSARADAVSSAGQHNKRGNYRKSRRNEEGANRTSRMNSNHGVKDGRPHEPHFELEATSFPPLPGSSNNNSSGDTPEGNKLSDVVKGTTRSGSSRQEDRVKASPAPVSSVVAPTPVSASAMVSPPSLVSIVSDAALSTATTTTTSAASSTTTTTAAAAVSTASSKETEVVANGNHSSSLGRSATTPVTSSSTAVESSAHMPYNKTSKTSSQSSSVATKSSTEPSITPKQSSVTTASVKATVTTPSPAPEVAPARLSYAQMVARKQQAENVAKQNAEEGAAAQQATATASAAARTSAQTTLREQSQTQASASVSASSPPKSASVSARPPSKEGAARKDSDPKEPRYPGGGRGAKENRNGSRQPRYDRRSGKVPAK